MSILLFLIIILALIVVIGILNEKFFHLQSDIALIMFSLVISAALLLISKIVNIEALGAFVEGLGGFGFEKYLMDGVLCFMLFSGAGKVNMNKFRQNVRAISLLALLTTMISSVAYGALFYLVGLIFNLPLDFITCVLLGCVVSPTDPIAATGILNKIGLSKNVCSVIENESLFNDGTGVTLFIFVRGLVIHSNDSNFFVLMGREILGAVAVALVVSFLLFRLMKATRDPIKYILISLLDVSLVYIICEHLGFSGVIASVVCGMYYSYAMGKMERRVAVVDQRQLYKDFWDIVESLLNSILFVMIGLLLLNIEVSRYVWIIVPAAIILNLLARAFGVSISCLLTGKNIPGNYNAPEYVTLMTWSALKGGLSLALAIGTGEFLPKEVYDIFINVTYVTIFFTVLVQGLTVKKVYFSLEKHKTARMLKVRKNDQRRKA
ncbi:MAG: sodium:proton antiporter [Lachnospiraceae bacterium]|nr:sodium:proton antiporter [Lachnospiraceae bacterium]